MKPVSNSASPTVKNTSCTIISYPWITAEVIPKIVDGRIQESKHAYEAVFNCWWVSVAPEWLRLQVLRASLEKKKGLWIPGVIYISDSSIIQSPSFEWTRRMFEEIFWNNVSFVGVNRSADTYENGFWLRVVVSEIDQISLRKAVEHSPESCVIASIPYADPAIAGMLKDLRDTFWNTLSLKTLELLAKNDRETPTLVAKEFVGYRGMLGSKAEVDALFESEPETIFVIKPVGHRAGGTSTQIIPPSQRKEFLEKFDEFPAMAYNFLAPCILRADNGQCFPVQIRPYAVWDSILGASIKMPGTSIHECVDAKTGDFRMPNLPIAKLNSRLNSSSWRSISAFIDWDGNFISWSKGMKDPLTQWDFNSLKTVSGNLSLWDPDNIRMLVKQATPLVQEVQLRTNELLWILR